MLKQIVVILITLGWLVRTVSAAVPDQTALESVLNRTADKVSADLGEGKGYSYYTYGTKELMYATGDLDGDGKPEIAARGVYYMGVGSYDLVDIFSDKGAGYVRLDFINPNEVGLQARVKSLRIAEGVLYIETTGIERGNTVNPSAAFRWNGPNTITRLNTSEVQASGAPQSVSVPPAIAQAVWDYKVIRGKKVAGIQNGAAGLRALNLFCEGNTPVFAVTFTATQPDPVRLDVQVGNMIHPFVLAHQPNSGGIRMVSLRDSAFPKKLLEGDAFALIRLNGVNYGPLSLKNAATASRLSLEDCYRF